MSRSVTEQIGAAKFGLLDLTIKIFGMDFRRLGQYADKSRRNVFIIQIKWKIGKAECFSKKQEMLFYFYKSRNYEQRGF